MGIWPGVGVISELLEQGLEQVLERVAEDVWVVEGPNVPFLGLSFGTRMTIIRLANDL